MAYDIVGNKRGECMIEIIYNKEKESAVGNEEYFCVPRNIRQIGQPSLDCKIYVEDYVYGYLAKAWKEIETKGKMAILLGKCNWKDGIFYIFLKSAIVMEKIEVSGEYISIKDETWGKIYEEMKEFFPGQEVIGWYLDLPGGGLKITDLISRIHLKHFGGNDKVLYLADSEEQDNAFFLYRNGRLEKQTGYYIFYEKNEPMQEYILAKNPKASVDFTGKAQDRAVSDFRKIIARKREEKEVKSSNKTFAVITTGAAMLAVVLGAMWVRNVSLEEVSIQDAINETIIDSVEQNTSEIAETVTEDVTNEVISNIVTDDTEIQMKDILNAQQEMQEIQEQVQTLEDNAEASSEMDTETSANQGTVVSETLAGSGYTEYTIREGDTLSNISQRYYGDMSRVVEICKINSMKVEDTIYPGQKILLP